jgi:hypothetical protein
VILVKAKRKVGIKVEVQNEMYLSGLWLSDVHHGLL